MRGVPFVIVTLASLALASCTGDSSTPVTPSDSAPILIGSVDGAPPSKVTVTGAPPTVGTSSQFTAVAVQTNGTTTVVTGLAIWASSNPSVATVNGSGMVTAAQTGSVEISATYQNVRGSLSFTVTTARTFTISGTVADAVSRAALPAASLTLKDAAGQTKSAVADTNGRYSIAGVAGGKADLTASVAGYSSMTMSISVAGDMIVNIPLSRASACPTLGFDDQQPHGARFAGYTACGFRVTPTTTNWTISTSYGHPAPFIQFTSAGGAANDGEITVTAGGTKFRFQSVELYSSTTPIPYVITGISNSAVAFTLQNTDYAEHAKLMMDLLALAYQTDLTRISTFMLAKEVSGRAYPEIGVPDSHHPVSHHQNEPAKLERLHKINEYHMQQFGHLVDKLAKIPEGDGTMLDSSLFLYGTGISDSNTHFHDDLPIALIGGKAAGITGGRYIRFPQGTPLANLHLTLLDKLGISIDKFGDSTGKLTNIFDAGLSNV